MAAAEHTWKPLKGAELVMAAFALTAANFVAVLDLTIANVSVANIAGSLGVSVSQGTWIITSYAVAEAIIVPLTGWMAARFGSVRVFTSAVFLFGVTSALCGLSQTFELLVLFRILQGFCGGLIMPLAQVLLLRIFPKEQANFAIGIWAMTTLVAPVLGPIVGGALCDNFGWPVIFLVNVPLALAITPLLIGLQKGPPEPTVKKRIDLVGLALLVIFVGALQLMLDLGKEHAWFESGLIVCLALIAAIGFVTFIIWELAEADPIVDIRIFRHRGFAAGVITLALGFGAIFSANMLTPLWLQTQMGYTSSWAGLATAWTGVLAVVLSPIVGQSMSRLDARYLIFAGLMLLAGITAFRAGLNNDATYWQIAIPLLITGAGLPMVFVPLTAVTLAAVEPHETESAAGLQNFLRTLSAAVGASIVSTTWEDKTTYAHAELAGLTGKGAGGAETFRALGLSPEQSTLALNRLVDAQSAMIATNQVMTLIAFAFAIAAITICFSPRPARQLDPTQTGH